MRIVISSLSLHKHFDSCVKNSCIEGGRPIMLSLYGNTLSIPNLSKHGVYFESRNKGTDIQIELTYKRMVEIRDILRLLGEQPIVLSFGGDRIEICNAVINW